MFQCVTNWNQLNNDSVNFSIDTDDKRNPAQILENTALINHNRKNCHANNSYHCRYKLHRTTCQSKVRDRKIDKDQSINYDNNYHYFVHFFISQQSSNIIDYNLCYILTTAYFYFFHFNTIPYNKLLFSLFKTFLIKTLK